MVSNLFHYIVIMVVAGVLNFFLGVYAYIKRGKFNGSTIFQLISLFSIIYTFGHVFELASYTIEMMTFWTYFQYLAIPYLAPLSFLLVLDYIGMEKYISKRNVFLMFIIPLLTTITVWTNPIHHLFYRSLFIRHDENTHFIGFEIGPWYIVHGSYSFAFLLAGIILLIYYWQQTKSVYWKQTIVMLTGLFLPMATSLLYVLGFIPHGLDPVPIVMSIAAALYILAFLSMNVLKLAPIARGLIFDTMRDGVVVLDMSQRIVDFNQSAKMIFSSLNDHMIGKPFYSIWKAHEVPFQTLLNLDHYHEFELEWNCGESYYQIRSSPVRKRNGKFVGSTIVTLDITEQRQLQKELEKLAYIDGLTEILNRSAFIERTKDCLQLGFSQKQSTSIILFDIDHFKQINDTYGHHIGDAVICHVVSICQKHLQHDDLFGRYGGEEFVLCLPSKSLHQATAIVEEIRKDIAGTPLSSEENITVTASFGVTEAIGNESIEELLHCADQALYESKQHGRNDTHTYKDGEIQSIILS